MTRLRNRALTEKPRVIAAYGGMFYAEQMTPMGPLVVLKDTFPEAIKLANEWASKKAETPC